MGILIVGAGPVGATLALLLHAAGVGVRLVEARTGGVAGDRTLALAHGSRLVLARAGAWSEALGTTGIDAIHVSHRGAFGRTVLTARDAGLPHLGYVLPLSRLQASLDVCLQASGIPVSRGVRVSALSASEARAEVTCDNGETVEAALVVLADGGANLTKVPGLELVSKDYGQTALVASVRTSVPPSGLAYERFTPTGPAALLPKGEEYALVWTASPAAIETLMALDDARFLAALREHFGGRAGEFVAVGKRSAFPLKLQYATPRASQRVAVVGAAAQTLHPVAGQGLNLGIRDAAELSRLLASAADPGSASLLARFCALRADDVRLGVRFTDFLVRTFSTANPVATVGRGVGLAFLDIAPPVRRWLAERMTFGV